MTVIFIPKINSYKIKKILSKHLFKIKNIYLGDVSPIIFNNLKKETIELDPIIIVLNKQLEQGFKIQSNKLIDLDGIKLEK